ncbi:acyl-CoA N-acyltransferase [Lipomyces starkeyi]|uniref:N-acetyltransferase domain-containing protein n=1 Tax=Lipomyces starkeyi NRRL Y-11557 TaxID=675824 RepID=A0A1E3Q568_LIPST|nr:hypothetical protein LIPSTDRAFT_71110 [Lipomyces starkeyi NRRL Y-11557]
MARDPAVTAAVRFQPAASQDFKMSPAAELRPMTIADVHGCHRLSQSVSWPHRAEDWEFVIRLGRGLVFIENGNAVASGLWWPHGERHATLGMIIVDPNRQGSGIGKHLMTGLLDQLGERSQILHATAPGEPLYGKLGFVAAGSVRQYQGEAINVPAPTLSKRQRLRPTTPADLPILLELDRQATGLPRQDTLAALLALGEGVVLEQDGEPVGFSILRPFGRGQVVGPAVASSAEEARMLIQHWLHTEDGRFLRIDVPGGTGLDDWLVEHGLAFTDYATMMVRGDKPAAFGPARLFALINQALG